MARKYKSRYEAEKDALAELVKMRNAQGRKYGFCNFTNILYNNFCKRITEDDIFSIELVDNPANIFDRLFEW